MNKKEPTPTKNNRHQQKRTDTNKKEPTPTEKNRHQLEGEKCQVI